MYRRKFGLACAALGVALAAPAAAQVPLNARALGMGTSYMGVARGQEVLFFNPANLALPGNPHWSIAFPQFGVGAAAIGVELGDLVDIADYGSQDQARRNEILAGIPATGTGLEGDVRVPIATVQVRRLVLGVSYNLTGSHTLDRDIVDLLFNGYQLGQSYSINNTEGFRASYLDFAAGYAHRVGPLSVGAAAHYFGGGDLVRSGVVDVQTVGLPNPDVRVTYAGVGAEGGSGFGLDLGAALQPMPGLTVSAAVSNVINTFEWDAGRVQRQVVLDRNDYENGDIGDILDRYDDSESAYDEGSASLSLRALAADLERDTGLPSVLRAGAAFQPLPGTTLSASFQTALSESRIAGLWQDSFGLGVQQRLAFLTLRAGVASNLDDGSLLSGGLSLGPLQFGVARLSNGDDRDGWVATFGLAGRSNSTMP